ncbi:hypothetical protein FACS1894217_09080 [Clostridia bacterium]|nr:hypothetical protein FACS1894217_09080 [Clostridia bacterium]
MNVFLIGLPGCGKTTIGRKLAELLGRQFIDLDESIEHEEKMTISEIFLTFGEPHFRKLECAALNKYSQVSDAIIATGGGIVKTSGNVETLRERGTVVFLDRVPDEQNVDWSNRPARAPMPQLVKERRPLYLSAADLVFPLGSDFCVIGDPIGHTLSPSLHSSILKSLGISAIYGQSKVSIQSLPLFAQLARVSGMRGFNVTIPHKKHIIPLLDCISDDAQNAEAVNTVRVFDGKLYGYNTDMAGLSMAIHARNNGLGYKGMHILLLGDGGAASGILYKAKAENAAKITVASRKNGGIVNAQIVAKIEDFDLVINATPLGMSGFDHDFTDFGFLDKLPSKALIYDLIYNPLETQLLREAKKRNLKTLNGLAMLTAQALLADAIFLEER